MHIAALDFGTMVMGLFGGLAVFLYGMELMTEALKTAAGSGMRKLLARLTTNRFKGVLAGGVTTAVIQSSSVTTVLTVGFVSAGLMSLQQSVGIIMGAEIGTTITAQIIAFKITKFAMAIVAVGFALNFFSKSPKTKRYGIMLFGFGLVFFGMNLMKGAMNPLRDHEGFLHLMQGMENPALGILTGALFTGLVQSSSATTGVVIVMGASGLISLEGAIALVLGANIGTCVTALLASIGKPRVAVQTALIHVTFNVAGVLLWFAFIPFLADFVRGLADDPARRIAHAHTTFNTLNTLIFIGFTGTIAAFVQRVLPLRPEAVPKRLRPKYLDDNLIPTPALALDRIALELGRLGKRVRNMVSRSPEAILEGTPDEIRAVQHMDEDVDMLHRAIVEYLGRISSRHLSKEETRQVQASLSIANYLENMADIVETDLASEGLRRTEHAFEISPSTRQAIDALVERVLWAVRRSVRSVRKHDLASAQDVIAAKPDVSGLADAATRHLTERLAAAGPDRLDAFRVESELIESLKRVYYVAKRIAKVVAEGGWPLERPKKPGRKGKKKKEHAIA